MIDYGSDTNGRIVYIKIECNHVPIVLVNVYAPAQITERCSFFKELFLYIPSTKWIIIGGDFNCTPNNQQDRNKVGAQTDNLSYRILIKEVINPLLLTEIFRRKQPRKIIYSYHASAGNYHSRIDLVFGSDIIYKNTHDIGYVPVGISDHDALVLSINIPPLTDKNMHRRWICNPNVIKRKSFLEKFQKIWNIIINTADLNTTEWWNDFKTSLIMIIQQEEKELNRETRRELDELSKEYRFRATNPSNDDLAQLEIIRKKIHDALTEKFINSIPSQGDRDFKCLSNLAKARFAHGKANQSRIAYLIHPSKGRVETDNEMMEICCNFYQDLYNVKPIDTSYWSELFEDITTLNQNDIDLLDRDITTGECLEALKAMQLGRVPGDDGLTIELWRFIFPIIGGHFIKMVNIAKDKGNFHDGFLNGLLTLLKKGSEFKGTMKSFRPLSLMNIDYKIITKVLSSRLKKVMNKIIHYNQTSGIPGRTIHDNIHLIRTIIDYHSRNRIPLGITMWDQEKAFDRVNHLYLFEVLRRFGFGNNFIHMIKLLYTNSTFTIKFNNLLSEKLFFNSGIRQGCSLSGYLYVLCLEPLLNLIRKNSKIPGVLVPGCQYRSLVNTILQNDETNIEIKTLAYADDVCTFVLNTNDELETYEMFKKYSHASGGKTNDTKTVIFWISDCLDPPSFNAKIEREKCTFLGIPMDTQGQLPQEEIDKMVNNIKRDIGLWSSIRLSLCERASILRCFIISRLVYWFSSMLINKNVIKSIQKICNSFFWGRIHPFIKFQTCVGRKEDGGFGLIHLESMIISYRIKCGLTITNTTPKIWKLFALPYVGLHLYKYAPWLWTNLIPHLHDDKQFFSDVAIHTAKWLKRGSNVINNGNDISIYWKLINLNIYQPPVCYERINHLKNIQFYKLIHHSKLPSNIIEFWTSLANYGINTHDRLGKTLEEKKCLFCSLPETLSHIFITCSFFNEIYKFLFEYIKNTFNVSIPRSEYEIIYLKIVSSTTSRIFQKQITYSIGNYLYAIWSYRCIINNRNQKDHPGKYQDRFMIYMKNFPFENG
ncbi:unnamed protein product [Rotaria socialis]|uniref:Reverse transcriptase domain-containing protein n=4 Tax=Rotaria socialis TaxID=392032 RepID=A0A818FWY9_9BILA|nr:unnamed protein product [Rotaria socialis]CAF3482518.1 unnamed protein product [Rotaria socialis]CAF4565942.1 unnamed protein product [Rotaria socialis]CAF4838012.1 unnamed protein product [Rotaria socialis]